ncbi:MAG: beta-galactosidase [Acidobacteria bacterium]|nr:MAG: beta-galactosidase [Acidobacteriota bacterium]
MKNRLLILALLLAMSGTGIAAPAGDRYKNFLFGADYYPEHWPESYWEPDAQWMKECGVNAVRMAEFAWYLVEPQEGQFDFKLFDRAIEVLARHGIKTILGTPTAAPPKWLTNKYPETLAVYSNGQPVDDQTRRHYCYNSPIYRRLSKRIVEEMVRHFAANPNVIGWQIDNEFNCHISECYSESCRVAFRQWLKDKYRDLSSLNTRWGNGFWSQWYTDWSQIDLPFPGPAQQNPALMLEFKRFISDSVISYQHDQVEIIRRQRPDDFITHNHMFKNINYYDFVRDLDIFAYDNYPCFWEQPQYGVGAQLTLARGLKGRMMVMEQQTGPGGQTYLLRSPRPGEMSLWAFQSIAHGADGMIHFRWRTARKGAEEYWYGVLDHDNKKRSRFEEFKKEGLQLQKIGSQIFDSKLDSAIAVIKDYDAEWVFDHQFFTEEVNVGSQFQHFFQAASEQKQNIDFIGSNDDFSRYKLIFGPHLILMDQKLATKIRQFVEKGGVFVLGAHTAVKDRDNGMTDQTVPILVGDVFGVERDEFQCYQKPSKDKNSIRFEDGSTVPVHVFADKLKLGTAKPIGQWTADYLRSTPGCTENRFGQGTAVYYASFFNLESTRYLLSRYARVLGLKPLMTGVPKEVEVTRRVKGDQEYYFILNHADSAVKVEPGAGFSDLLEGKPAPAAFTMPPFGYMVLGRKK